VWRPVERELRSASGNTAGENAMENSFLVAGVDEVGRGPLAGPVVACAVIMPPDDPCIDGVADSKLVKRAERERLVEEIMHKAIAVGIGAASVREIDQINIYQATVLAMRRAIHRLGITPGHVVIDGKPIRTLEIEHTAIVGGDAVCYSIACASLVAKVTRDRVMAQLAKRHPAYAWERNAGYGTRAHLEALSAAGICVHHRKSFGPVQCLIP